MCRHQWGWCVMIQLLVIADDFTGALDTGVQLSSCGARTDVIVGPIPDEKYISEKLQVLVVDAETRHCSPVDAYNKVCDIVGWAIKKKIPYIYKKTDSALRGNIGSELEALLTTSGEKQLPFVPAFPKLNRYTRDGIHYVNGLPVSEGAFGQDPYETVTDSVISDIIARTSRIPSFSVKPGTPVPDKYGIFIFDAESEADLHCTAANLPQALHTRILAGCAGFAAILPALIGLAGNHEKNPPVCSGLLAVCGSVHPISRSQCAYAERNGAPRICLTGAITTDTNWPESDEAESLTQDILWLSQSQNLIVLDTSDAELPDGTREKAMAYRCIIRDNLGFLLKKLFDGGLTSTVLIMGGDALMGLMKALGVNTLSPVCEVEPGIVLSRFQYQGKITQILSKSGGFGSESIFTDLCDRLAKQKKETVKC